MSIKNPLASFDISLTNIWQSWYLFRTGKRSCPDLEHFSYYLEKNLFNLYRDLNSGNYQHGDYREFTVYDNKKRKISVAQVRDRVVHRLVYEYLVPIYDKTFIYDVWSCRVNKGLLGAIKRSYKFLTKFPESFIWRADIKKFFDNVNQEVLFEIIKRKITDNDALRLIRGIIKSYFISQLFMGGLNRKGLPIGNLTSQIFANIYLNELDRFIKHNMKPIEYLRYGDDFIILEKDLAKLEKIRENTIRFIENNLHLKINSKNDIIVSAKQGIKFLGVKIYPDKLFLNKRNVKRVNARLNLNNASSYYGMIKQYSKNKLKEYSWRLMEKLYDE